jgi:hypothetical protein
MRKRTVVLMALVAAAGLWLRPPARAADHADGPAASADPTADITDVLAWMSPDARQLHLVMDLVRDARPAHRFSDQVQYVFHTSSRATFGATSATSYDIICEFDPSGEIRCWSGTDEFMGGDASNPAGLVSRSGRLRVFAGLRNDPFFFNLRGFQATARTVAAAAPALSFDAAGCPRLDAATSAALVNSLRTTDGGAAVDGFNGFNVLALAIAVDKTLVTRGGPIVGVWGSTHRKP